MQELYTLPGLRAFAAVVPFSLAVLGSLIANFPVSFTGGALPAPLFGIMPVFFWGLLRPDLMPPWAALLAGFAEDLFSGAPPGLWAASFVAAYVFVDRQRDALAGFAGFGAIIGFVVALFVAMMTAFAIVAIYYWRLPPTAPLVTSFMINVVWYVPALWVMNRVQHNLVGPLRSEF